MANNLQHFGITGMRWGKHKARPAEVRTAIGNAAKTAGSSASAAAKKAADNVATAFKEKHASRAETPNLLTKITDNKAFKTLVFDKNDTTGLIFKKSEVEKLKNFFTGAKSSLATGFHKWQISSQDRDIKLMKEIANQLKDSKNPREQKLAKEHADAAAELERDLNSLYTPEELKKYRSE